MDRRARLWERPPARVGPALRSESGQATAEWPALMGVVTLALAVLGATVTPAAGWRLGESVLHAIVCAAGGWCDERESPERVYGPATAALVRQFAPNVVYERRSAELPVDFRRCRRLECSNGPDRPGPIGRSAVGLPVTAFTRVIDGRARGQPLYLQYWLYFPESFTGGIGRVLGHRWPGFHPDDWEGYQVRISPGGTMSARATAHGSYKGLGGAGGWGPWTGWYRVSGGSHAGHLVTRPGDERTTAAADVRLVPLEGMPDTDLHRFSVSPPWRKEVFRDPESDGS